VNNKITIVLCEYSAQILFPG